MKFFMGVFGITILIVVLAGLFAFGIRPGGFNIGYDVDFGTVVKVHRCSPPAFGTTTKCRVTLDDSSTRTVPGLVVIGDVLEATCYEPNNSRCYYLRLK